MTGKILPDCYNSTFLIVSYRWQYLNAEVANSQCTGKAKITCLEKTLPLLAEVLGYATACMHPCTLMCSLYVMGHYPLVNIVVALYWSILFELSPLNNIIVIFWENGETLLRLTF